MNTLDGYIKTVLQHAKCRKKHEFNITFDDILEIYNNKYELIDNFSKWSFDILEEKLYRKLFLFY